MTNVLGYAYLGMSNVLLYLLLKSVKLFAGVMTSMIASPDEPKYLSTPHQLFNQNDTPWIVESGSSLEYYGLLHPKGSLLR